MKLITNVITILAIGSCTANNCSSLSKRNCKKDDTCEYFRKSGDCKAKAGLVCSDYTGMGKKCREFGCEVDNKVCGPPKPAITDCAAITKVSKCKKDPQCSFVKKTKSKARHCKQNVPATTPAPTTPAPTTPAPTTPAPTPAYLPTTTSTQTYCTESRAMELAFEIGWEVNGCGGSAFSGSWGTKGLYGYTGANAAAKYLNCAFFGTGDGDRNSVLPHTYGQVRIANWDCPTTAPPTTRVHGSGCQTDDQCPSGLHCISHWMAKDNKICMYKEKYFESSYDLDTQWYKDGTTTTYWSNYEG